MIQCISHVLCPGDTHHTFVSISHFLKPIEESGTEARTETVPPTSTLLPLRLFPPFFPSIAFYLYLSLHDLNRLHFRTCTTCLEEGKKP